ncbi:metaxin [Chloropicon roscoffensis]|uniref:Metaxin n=2 Tax=Chloropicon roscoffensis TaxID=1461544 RepID=A0AAX4NZA4_9CHLO
MESVTLYKFEAGWGLPSFSPECVALEAYLRLSGIRFAEESVTSANSSPTGRLPALDIDGLAVGSWEDGEGSGDGEAASVSRVLDGLRKAGVDLDKGLSVEDACDLEAYLSLAENALAVATQWALWCDDQSYAEGTRVFYSGIYPFPLSHIFPWRQRREALAKMKALGVTSEEQVTELLHRAYKSLERKLRHKKYFFGRPTTLDAVAYAHLLLHRSSPVGALLYKDVLGKYPALSKYVDGISEAHFGPGAGLRDPADVEGVKIKRRKRKSKGRQEKEEFKGAGVWITTTVTVTALTLLGSVLSLS